MERKEVSKKVRFSILERDGFRCAYCGRTASEECLHVDHIIPIAEGGTNHESNLITACQDCNLGKGSRRLKEESRIKIGEAEFVMKREELEKLERYARLVNDIITTREEILWSLVRRWASLVGECQEVQLDNGEIISARTRFLNNITAFISKLPPHEIITAMEVAASKFHDDNSRAWRYACGILWPKIRESEEQGEEENGLLDFEEAEMDSLTQARQ